MQSFFRVSEMESTDKPPTPMAAVSDGRKFHNCASCTSRMPSIVFDAHTLCIGCRDQVCDAPLKGIILPNPINPVFRLSTAPVSDETPVHRLAASDRKLQELKLNVAATRRAIDSFCDGGA